MQKKEPHSTARLAPTMNSASASPFELYTEVAGLAEAEFHHNAERFKNHRAPDGGQGLKCRLGCTACCPHLFEISLLEAVMISRVVNAMPQEQQAALRERAREYKKQRQGLLDERAQKLKVEHIEGRLPVLGLRLACPALEGEACSVYNSRPLICRKFGMPIYDPRRPGQVGACELNFSPGEAIDDDGLVTRQTALFNRWEEVKREVEDRVGWGKRELTVADAILEDFDGQLARQGGLAGRNKS